MTTQDLARLSLLDPEYLAVHEAAVAPTPVKLQQAFMEVQPADKLNTLWSFIRTHLKVEWSAHCPPCVWLHAHWYPFDVDTLVHRFHMCSYMHSHRPR